MMRQILSLDPARYQRHAIHGENRVWVETNCYVDVWVELLHAWGFEPIAALPFTVAIDFEGDQWTFFKFPHADLDQLYGLDVQELALWRPLACHVEEQVALGRPVLVELDSYYLPDTAGTAYHHAHVKSTAAITAIDIADQRLGYFHNQAYHHLTGADFINVFRLGDVKDPAILPPFAELVKQSARPALAGNELTQASVQSLRRHLLRTPTANPFEKFKARFEADLAWLGEAGLEAFHAFSFATLRQFGACYELAATYLEWLEKMTRQPLGAPITAFASLATGAKALQFQLARVIARKKPLGLTALDDMAKTWHTATDTLKEMFL